MIVTHRGEKYEVIISHELLPEIKAVRTEVFINEQGFENEFDDIDKTAVHCLLTKNGAPAAVGRLYDENGIAHIGRIAVVKTMRGKGLGSVVLAVLEKYAAEHGYTRTALSAQCRVQTFYETNGYHAEGEIYFDEY